MANINTSALIEWVRYVPDLGDNREQEKPFHLEVKSGLSVLEFDGWIKKLSELVITPESLTECFAEVVRMGKEPLHVDGKPIADLGEYVSFLLGFTGLQGISEMREAVGWANSVRGRQELFSGRLSGGFASTARPRASERAAH